jgi:hypothetical protein
MQNLDDDDFLIEVAKFVREEARIARKEAFVDPRQPKSKEIEKREKLLNDVSSELMRIRSDKSSTGKLRKYKKGSANILQKMEMASREIICEELLAWLHLEKLPSRGVNITAEEQQFADDLEKKLVMIRDDLTLEEFDEMNMPQEPRLI